MILWILRGVLLLASAGAAVSIIKSEAFSDAEFTNPWLSSTLVFVGVLGLAVGVTIIDHFTPQKRIDVVSCIYFGILIGLFLTLVVVFTIDPLIGQIGLEAYSQSIRITIGLMLSYFCISMLLQTRDDFRFIIPYVEFSKEVKGIKPYLLDTSVVIDGRIADLVETHCVR